MSATLWTAVVSVYIRSCNKILFFSFCISFRTRRFAELDKVARYAKLHRNLYE